MGCSTEKVLQFNVPGYSEIIDVARALSLSAYGPGPKYSSNPVGPPRAPAFMADSPPTALFEKGGREGGRLSINI